MNNCEQCAYYAENSEQPNLTVKICSLGHDMNAPSCKDFERRDGSNTIESKRDQSEIPEVTAFFLLVSILCTQLTLDEAYFLSPLTDIQCSPLKRCKEILDTITSKPIALKNKSELNQLVSVVINNLLPISNAEFDELIKDTKLAEIAADFPSLKADLNTMIYNLILPLLQ